MVENGDSLRHIAGNGAPLMSVELGKIAAAFVCGFPPSSDHWLLDVVEATDPTARTFVATFAGETHATFGGEVVTLSEFKERFDSLEWCAAHEDHPITYMARMWRQILRLRDDLRERKPSIRFQKQWEDEDGKYTATAIVSPGMSSEEKSDVLKRFEEAG